MNQTDILHANEILLGTSETIFQDLNETLQGMNQTSGVLGPLRPIYNPGDIAWMLMATALVWLMVPGVGYFYSGMAQSKNALHLIILSCWSIAVVCLQWFVVGYSLTFSGKGNFFIGNFDHVVLNGVLDDPSALNPKIPELVFCIYQAMFAAITPALAIGAAAERGRFFPTIVFILLWTTFVYDFIAYWTWNPKGWSSVMGGLDFAGGTPVHISSGAAALAYAVILGRRDNIPDDHKPHNMVNVVLGTCFIWFGWFGFNGGSALDASVRAVMACVVTNLAACTGGITWVLIDYRKERKFSAMGFCAGAVSALVCITPASGFVSPSSSIAFGVAGAFFCNMALNLKHWLNYDDALDVFAVHGVGGIVGNLLTGVFAQKWVAALDGTIIDGGGLDGNWKQVGKQAIDSVAGLGWSFVITFIILFLMNKIPGLSLRAKIETERAGMDQTELGISCYEYIEDVKTNGNGSRGGSKDAVEYEISHM